MSSDHEANDEQGAAGDGLGLSQLEQQISERMAQLHSVAEEYYKLQILLDTIDGRDVLPTPDYLVPLLPEPEPVDEQRRLQARRRAAERAGRLGPRRRKAPPAR